MTASFTRPFRLRDVDRVLSPGTGEGVTADELIEGPIYRRVSTIMLVPGLSASALEMATIDPIDPAVEQDLDGSPPGVEAR